MSKWTETRDDLEAKAKPFFLAYPGHVAEQWLDHVFTAFITMMLYFIFRFVIL